MPKLSFYRKSAFTQVIFLTIAVLLLACKQQPKQTHPPAIPASETEDTEDLLTGRKAELDNLLGQYKDSSTSFKEHDLRGGLQVGYLFSKNNKHAVLHYFINDSTYRLIVLKQSGNEWDTVFANDFTDQVVSAFDDYIEISDFNGDHIPDLKAVKDHWDIHVGERSDLWLYKDDRFTPVKGFDKIVSANYDTGTRRIYSYHSTGCADMSMYFGVFRIDHTSVQNVQEMACDCCYKDSCIITVYGKKPVTVPLKKAYRYVPSYFAEGVKEKCEL